MMVQTGACDVVIAGGVESMSNVEYYTTDMRWGKRAGSTHLHDRLARGREISQPVERFGVISGMIETAENLARDYRYRREAADTLRQRKPPARGACLGRRQFFGRGRAGVGAAEEGRRRSSFRATRASAPTRRLRAWQAPADREGRRGHRRQCQPAERCGRRLLGRRRRQARRAGPRAHGLSRRLGRGRLRPCADGHRPGRGVVKRSSSGPA